MPKYIDLDLPFNGKFRHRFIQFIRICAILISTLKKTKFEVPLFWFTYNMIGG